MIEAIKLLLAPETF